MVYRSFVYTVYFLSYADGKEERKKKKSKIEIFMFDFPDCEEKSWDSGAVFYIRIAKGFCL